MPAPTQSGSLYKRRVISAMLDSPAVETSPPPGEPRRVWSRDLVYFVFALAFISAGAGVFFLLYHRDSSAVSQAAVATVSVPQTEVRRVPLTVEQSVPLLVTKANTPKPKVVDSESLPIRLSRSRSYRNVGPAKLRLVRVDVRRKTCDINFQSKDHRFVQRRFQMSQTLQVKVGRNAPIEVTVSTITKDSVVLAVDEIQ